MTANTATKSQYYIYTQLLELLGSKEASFCSLKIVTAKSAKTAAIVNKIGALYANIYRIYSKNSKNSHSKHIIYVSISAVSTVSAVSAGAVQKKTILRQGGIL